MLFIPSSIKLVYFVDSNNIPYVSCKYVDGVLAITMCIQVWQGMLYVEKLYLIHLFI